MKFKWDETEDIKVYPDLSYNLQILTDTDILLQDLSIKGSTTYTYSYAQMLADYKKINISAGIYRTYKARIKVVGTLGQESVSWVYVNEEFTDA